MPSYSPELNPAEQVQANEKIARCGPSGPVGTIPTLADLLTMAVAML